MQSTTDFLRSKMVHSITLTVPLLFSHPKSFILVHQCIIVTLLLLYPSSFPSCYLDFQIIPYVFILLEQASKAQAPGRSSSCSFPFTGKLKSLSRIRIHDPLYATIILYSSVCAFLPFKGRSFWYFWRDINAASCWDTFVAHPSLPLQRGACALWHMGSIATQITPFVYKQFPSTLNYGLHISISSAKISQITLLSAAFTWPPGLQPILCEGMCIVTSITAFREEKC